MQKLTVAAGDLRVDRFSIPQADGDDGDGTGTVEANEFVLAPRCA